MAWRLYQWQCGNNAYGMSIRLNAMAKWRRIIKANASAISKLSAINVWPMQPTSYVSMKMRKLMLAVANVNVWPYQWLFYVNVNVA